MTDGVLDWENFRLVIAGGGAELNRQAVVRRVFEVPATKSVQSEVYWVALSGPVAFVDGVRSPVTGTLDRDTRGTPTSVRVN